LQFISYILVPEGIIRPVVSASELTWCIRYIHCRNLQFLNNVIINKTKALLPQAYKKGCTRLAAASDKVYQLLAHGRRFTPGTPASSTTKTGRPDIAEILLKVGLNTINQIKSTDATTRAGNAPASRAPSRKQLNGEQERNIKTNNGR
jgi:hypothetical protein